MTVQHKKEERRISPAVIIIPLALGLAGAAVLGLAAMARAGVTPPPAGKAKFYMDPIINFTVQDGTWMGMYWHYRFSNIIINNGTEAGTYDITHEILVNGTELFERAKKTISLEPGETYEWWREIDIDWRQVSYVKVSLSGNWEEDNYSEVTVSQP